MLYYRHAATAPCWYKESNQWLFFFNVTLARNRVAPWRWSRIETCWGDFKCFNVTFYVCALVGKLIKWLYEMYGATIKKACAHCFFCISILISNGWASWCLWWAYYPRLNRYEVWFSLWMTLCKNFRHFLGSIISILILRNNVMRNKIFLSIRDISKSDSASVLDPSQWMHKSKAVKVYRTKLMNLNRSKDVSNYSMKRCFPPPLLTD